MRDDPSPGFGDSSKPPGAFPSFDTPHRQAFQDLARLAAQMCGAPVAAICLVAGDRLVMLGRVGWEPRDIARSAVFSPFELEGRQPMVVRDVRQDARFTRAVLDGLPSGIRSCATVPLIAPDGPVVGTLCVMDGTPREFTRQHTEALQILARQVLSQLELWRRGGRTAPWIAPAAPDRPTRRHETVIRKLRSVAAEGELALPEAPPDRSTPKGPIRILVLEDDAAVVHLIWQILTGSSGIGAEIVHCESLRQGLQALDEKPCEAVLLDLELPDSRGLDTVGAVHERAPDAPIVVLTGHDDEDLALQALREGAQDYLFKGEFDRTLLVRALRYAVERQRLKTALRTQALTDDLTHLYNRRGFRMLADQQLRFAERGNRAIAVVFADLDGLKEINDTFGHAEGDRALVETAQVLRETFRRSDIVARIGGDEFVVMALESSGSDGEIVARLRSALNVRNTLPNRRYRLSLSVGISHCDPNRACSPDELVAWADAAMYADKKTPDRPDRG